MRRLLNARGAPATLGIIAIILAAGGGAYAATTGGGTITACIHHHGGGFYRASHCARHDKTLSWNARGRRGRRGPAGSAGPAGPGAISIDRQFPIDGLPRGSEAGGVVVGGLCATNPETDAVVSWPNGRSGEYAWGTEAADGGAPTEASVSPDGRYIQSAGKSRAELDVVAENALPGQPVRWTRVDITVIQGSMCHLHALVTPSSSDG